MPCKRRLAMKWNKGFWIGVAFGASLPLLVLAYLARLAFDMAFRG